MRNKPYVGQKVFSLNIGNAARHVKQELTPCTVTKVGRKYFYAAKDGFTYERKYGIDDWIEATEYSPDSCLYESVQEYEDEISANALYDKIRTSSFSAYRNRRISYSKLKQIADILGIEWRV